MSLHIDNITLYNWRNFSRKNIGFDENLTVLAGKNASGKTNTVEAIQLLTSKKSFRRPKTYDLIKQGESIAFAQAELSGDTRNIVLKIHIDKQKRTVLRNGKKIQQNEGSQDLFPVLFIPDDLSLIKQSASYRRDALDLFGSLAHSGYKKLLYQFERSIKQRNIFLKNGIINNDELEVLDYKVTELSTSLLIHRLSLFTQLTTYTKSIYNSLVSRETLSFSYEPSWTDKKIGELSPKQIWQEIFKALTYNREKDFILKQTSIGPHRDNFSFYINKQNAKVYASQGQQRSIVLAWKMAQIQFIQEVLQETPLLLLDDVMSELDEKRREAIMFYIKKGVQTIITTTHLEYFTSQFLKQAKVVVYD